MRTIKTGDTVDVWLAHPQTGEQPMRVVVDHVPQDTGDSWYVTDGNAVEMCFVTYALMVKVPTPIARMEPSGKGVTLTK